ncbi:MAG TPA: pyridoxamine 5'-phosphate oxidase family protein [Noviherbaspirillum sp.]|jgi:putative heme iron utilization protein|uniref:HugZ family pyridoxamine 5'-phosphate oxidase n=1 Tax=Noviherbaspirillum sp. TaxID=1926288 RepID=UPI002F93503C
MKPEFDSVLHLLHGSAGGTLATHSQQLPGYPYATALPFAPDEAHRPVFLASGLAEHTKNLLADSRASFLVAGGDAGPAAPRVTLLGDAVQIEAAPALQARYLRYQPDAEQYLALGDFAFFLLQPKRARIIGGFAQMGWMEEADWRDAMVLALEDEATLIQDLLGELPPRVRLIGLDCYGIDVERQGQRERQRFPGMLDSVEQIRLSAKRLLSAL